MNQQIGTDGNLSPAVEDAFTLIGKKWTGLLIHVLGDGPRRFSSILREISQLSPRILTQRLKELESEGLAKRTVIPSSPVQVEYRLTEKGRQLIPLMKGIAEWANTWSD